MVNLGLLTGSSQFCHERHAGPVGQVVTKKQDQANPPGMGLPDPGITKKEIQHYCNCGDIAERFAQRVVPRMCLASAKFDLHQVGGIADMIESGQKTRHAVKKAKN